MWNSIFLSVSFLKGGNMEITDFFVDEKIGLEMCRLAILLAMTTSPEMESTFIEKYREMGIKSGITMISGYNPGSEGNVIRKVINLCLNTNIISRRREHVHPVAHCALEAMQSTRVFDAISQNCRFKVAVVRKGNHFAMCLYGDLAMHELSGHKTIGVGFQILGD